PLDIYTLSLHDALPILSSLVVIHRQFGHVGRQLLVSLRPLRRWRDREPTRPLEAGVVQRVKVLGVLPLWGSHRKTPFPRTGTTSDRKSTRLNSSHDQTS